MPSRGWAGFGLQRRGVSSQLPAPFYSVARSNFRSPKRWADSWGAEPGMLEFPQSFLYMKAGMPEERDPLATHRPLTEQPKEGTLELTLLKPLSRERVFWRAGSHWVPSHLTLAVCGLEPLNFEDPSQNPILDSAYRSLLPTSPSLNAPSIRTSPQIRSAFTGFSAPTTFQPFLSRPPQIHA